MTTSVRFDRLETERLIMRRWQESDRAPFAELNADPETMRFFPDTLDRAASDAVIEMIETRFDRQGFGFWALEVAATGTFIGFTGLNPLPDGVPGAGGMEVGWRLARHAWHHGYATEAARAALGVAFDNMGLPEIWSMTAVLNEPSRAVMRRLGLTETTRFDHPRIPAGNPLRPQVAYHGTRPANLRTGALSTAEIGQRRVRMRRGVHPGGRSRLLGRHDGTGRDCQLQLRSFKEPVDVDLLAADVCGVPLAADQQGVDQRAAERIQVRLQRGVVGHALDARRQAVPDLDHPPQQRLEVGIPVEGPFLALRDGAGR